jgi:hypothetical protein
MADYFYNAIRRDIVMIKNDTLSFGFQVQGLEGQIPSNIVFTCKETPESAKALFTVSLANHIQERSYDAETDIRTYVLRIPPELTEKVELGRYFYDIQFTVNYDILTLMIGRLTVSYQVTGGNVDPTPDYENGDNVKYPLIGIPSGTIKLYTEQWISDIATAINEAYDVSGLYTTREMSEAIRSIVGFTPTFNETVIAHGIGSNPIYLPEGWDHDYQMIKIVLADTRDSNRKMIYYTTPSQLINISVLEGYIRLYMRHPDVALGYVNYSFNAISRELTQRGTGNVLYIEQIIGLTGVNCTINSIDIDMALSLPVLSRTISTLYNLYDFDLILITVNNGNYTNCVPLVSIISPYKSTNPFKEFIEYYLDDPANGASITIAAHSMSEANYLAVTGVKFIKN